MTALVRNIPPSLWREFKAACAADGRTMNQAIIDLIACKVGRAGPCLVCGRLGDIPVPELAKTAPGAQWLCAECAEVSEGDA